jgi:hypothetical protein
MGRFGSRGCAFAPIKRTGRFRRQRTSCATGGNNAVRIVREARPRLGREQGELHWLRNEGIRDNAQHSFAGAGASWAGRTTLWNVRLGTSASTRAWRPFVSDQREPMSGACLSQG